MTNDRMTFKISIVLLIINSAFVKALESYTDLITPNSYDGDYSYFFLLIRKILRLNKLNLYVFFLILLFTICM